MKPEIHQLARIRSIWSDSWFAENCFALWEAHLKWLHDAGFDRALFRQDPPPLLPAPTGHEVVDLLARFVSETGLVNAHLGLTSSDIVDNVRLMQVQQSIQQIADLIDHVLTQLSCSFAPAILNGQPTLAFTHWQPAAPISWQQRVRAWTDPLAFLHTTQPCIFAKKFGGPVGDAHGLHAIFESIPADPSSFPFDWHLFELEHPRSNHPLQSSDHHCELHAAGWCLQIAGQVHKIATDLRFLASHGIVLPGSVIAGSSSMPHKVNPFKWEKVTSCCRSVASTHREIWDVLAHNSMERTLDTSWQLKHSLQRMFESLALALREFALCELTVDLTKSNQLLAEHSAKVYSDRYLTRRVLGGQDRWSAYWEMLEAR